LITYLPEKLLSKIAPASKIKKMLTGKLTLKRAALSFIDDIDFLDKKDVTRVALNTVNAYKKRVSSEVEDGATKSEAVAEIKDDPALLIQRVQNEVVTQVSDEIRKGYHGEFYVWLPSDANEPDPEHQLNYGKTFQIGVGEQPGDRYGCRCGMEILVEDSQLDLTNQGET